MSDRERAIVTVIGGAIALLIAVLSSLAIGPGPIFTFDKVVVGALLVGGLGAFGVAINIGQSPAAKAARQAELPPRIYPPLPTEPPIRSFERVQPGDAPAKPVAGKDIPF